MIENSIYCLIDYFHLLPTGVYVIFVICFIIQISFFTFLSTAKIAKKNASMYNFDRIPVSVIIAAKNEAEHLKQFLPKVLEQEYPNFEVIVIDDASSDSTSDVLRTFSHKYKQLTIVSLSKSTGKKVALSEGILKARYEHLLFTDADCYPLSRFWIKEMTSSFSNECDIVIGYGPYEKRSGFASAFISYDTYNIALQYFSAASIGMSYMAVGRNLAYTKSIWESVSGFERHKDVLSGDDDLFVSQAATTYNVGLCVNKRAYTYSIPKSTISEYIKQKSRHLTTSKHYSNFSRIFSSVEMISRPILFLSFIYLVFADVWMYALIFYLFRIFYIYLIGIQSRNQFNAKIRFHSFVIFDIFAPVFYLMVVIYSRFIRKSTTW